MVRVPYICAQTSAVSRGYQLDPSVTLRISYQQHPVSNLCDLYVRIQSLYCSVEYYKSPPPIVVLFDGSISGREGLARSPPETQRS